MTLTPQQARVAQLVAQGMSNKEVARAMGLALGTVKVHLSVARSKVGGNSRVAFANLAQTIGEEMSHRIYLVSSAEGQSLVRAGTQAAAIHHVVRGKYSAVVAAQETIVELLTAGQTVLDASAPVDQPEAA